MEISCNIRTIKALIEQAINIMPLYLEHVTAPSEQDLIDLEKVYQDYPTELRFNTLQTWLQDHPEAKLLAGRFNDRLIGAFTIEPQENHLNIDHLCVRGITRQRHVARDMFRQIFNFAPEQTLILEACESSEALSQHMQTQGFEEKTPGHFVKAV